MKNMKIKKYYIGIVVLLMVMCVLPVKEINAGNISEKQYIEEMKVPVKEKTVTANQVCFRREPGLNSATFGHFKAGDKVLQLNTAPVYRDGYTWVQVQRFDGKTGWVASVYLR